MTKFQISHVKITEYVPVWWINIVDGVILSENMVDVVVDTCVVNSWCNMKISPNAVSGQMINDVVILSVNMVDVVVNTCVVSS